MRKNALIICCYVAAAGAFGTFIRWLQNQIVFDTETGLVNSSILNVLLPLIMIGAAVLFVSLSAGLLKKYKAPVTVQDAFRGTTMMFPIVAWIVAVLMIAGGFLTMLGSTDDRCRGLYAVVSALAILTGLCFPMVCTASVKRYSPGMVSAFMTVPILMMILWLVTAYKANASNPNTWVYAVEILATAAALIAFYFTAGYPYGRPRPFSTLVMAMTASFLCFTALADERYFGLQLMFLSCAGMLMTEVWMIVSNMKPKTESDAVQPEASEAAETAEAGEPSSEEHVLMPGGPDLTVEPTRQAFDSTQKDKVVDDILREMEE